jgi:peptidoglycan-associated lipoprotein
MNVLEMRSFGKCFNGRLLLVALLAIGLGAGCGHKRKNVIQGPGGAQSTGGGSGRGDTGGMGGDINSVPPTGGAGIDFPSTEETGPLAPVYFEYDSATVTADAQQILQHHALWIKDHPGSRIALEGHCDERGTVEYNLALGEQRARAVYDYLTSLGVPGTRLSTVSFGKERPVDPGHNEQAWAKNRRVHFAVSG